MTPAALLQWAAKTDWNTTLARAWLDVLREDNRAIVRAASAASKAADFILGYGPHERQAPPS